MLGDEGFDLEHIATYFGWRRHDLACDWEGRVRQVCCEWFTCYGAWRVEVGYSSQTCLWLSRQVVACFEGRDMSSCKVAANKLMISKAVVLSMVRCLQLAMGVATQLAAVLFCFFVVFGREPQSRFKRSLDVGWASLSWFGVSLARE